jgi:SNF2 family DNA or RNA helicase
VLVVAPNTAKETVWRNMMMDYLPDHAIYVMPNAKKKREMLMAFLKDEVDEPFVLIAHYEALNLIGKERSGGRGWDRYGKWDIVIADEAHRIKNERARMSRSLKKIGAKYKLALSGSIVQNHAEELFSPLQWLFPDLYKAKWRDWNDRYLDYVDGGYSRLCVGIQLDKLDEMRAELGTFMVYRRKKDELDLPPRTDQTLYVDLSASQRKVYEELVATCVARIDESTTIKAADGLPMLTKLRQVASGLDLLAEKVTDSTKLDLTMDLIRDSEEPTVVFVWYKAAGRALIERLNKEDISATLIDGDVPQADRDTRIEAFTNTDGVRVLVGTIATMGESVNLQRASQAIFVDRHWNPGANIQAEDRIYRLGQENPVTITHIIARDTVDQHRVLPTLVNKDALRRLILGG